MAKSPVLALVIACLTNGANCLGAQSADLYRGTVTNSALPLVPATLELSIFYHSDTLNTGWLTIGAPLSGSGSAIGVPRARDSLLLVSASPTGDTILWVSPTRNGSIGGWYVIRSGAYEGQRGTWSLQPAPKEARLPLALAAFLSAAMLALMMLGIAHAGSPRWWAWRTTEPLDAIPDARRRELTGVSGWLAWFVFGYTCVVILQLVTIPSAIDQLGTGVWMLEAAISGTRPVLFTESVSQILQIIGVVLGLGLIFRASPLTPLYWVLLLLAFIAFGIYDLNETTVFVARMKAQFGNAAAAQAAQAVSQGSDQNWRVVLFGVGWIFYWIRSRRVRLSFGEARPGAHAWSRRKRSDELAVAPPSPLPAGLTMEPATPITPQEPRTTDTRLVRRCPWCAEQILSRAQYCKHCHRNVEPLEF